jgi:hypothetical protein
MKFFGQTRLILDKPFHVLTAKILDENHYCNAHVNCLFSSRLILPLPNLAAPEEFVADNAFPHPAVVDW